MAESNGAHNVKDWEIQFLNIQKAMANTRVQSGYKGYDGLSAEEREIKDQQELLELKMMALDGVETRIKDAKAKLEETEKLKKELQTTKTLYFNSLFVNIKLSQLIQTSSPRTPPALNPAELFEKCQDLPMSEWPSFVSNAFFPPKETGEEKEKTVAAGEY